MLYIWYVVLVEIKPFLHKTLALKTNNKNKTKPQMKPNTNKNKQTELIYVIPRELLICYVHVKLYVVGAVGSARTERQR